MHLKSNHLSYLIKAKISTSFDLWKSTLNKVSIYLYICLSILSIYLSIYQFYLYICIYLFYLLGISLNLSIDRAGFSSMKWPRRMLQNDLTVKERHDRSNYYMIIWPRRCRMRWPRTGQRPQCWSESSSSRPTCTSQRAFTPGLPYLANHLRIIFKSKSNQGST